MIERDKIKFFDGFKPKPAYPVFRLETNPYIETENDLRAEPYKTGRHPVPIKLKWWEFWKKAKMPKPDLPPLSRINLVVVCRDPYYVDKNGVVEREQQLMMSHIARLVKTVPVDGELVLRNDQKSWNYDLKPIIWQKTHAELQEFLRQPEESEIYCTNPTSMDVQEYDTRKIERVQALGREILDTMKNQA